MELSGWLSTERELGEHGAVAQDRLPRSWGGVGCTVRLVGDCPVQGWITKHGRGSKHRSSDVASSVEAAVGDEDSAMPTEARKCSGLRSSRRCSRRQLTSHDTVLSATQQCRPSRVEDSMPTRPVLKVSIAGSDTLKF